MDKFVKMSDENISAFIRQNADKVVHLLCDEVGDGEGFDHSQLVMSTAVLGCAVGAMLRRLNAKDRGEVLTGFCRTLINNVMDREEHNGH